MAQTDLHEFSAAGVIEATLPDANGVTTYFGFSIYSAAGAVVRIEAADSGGSDARLLDVVSLSAGESARECYAHGVDLPRGYGVKITLDSGTVDDASIRTEA